MSTTDTELLALCAAWRPANEQYMAVSDRLDDINENDQSVAERTLGHDVSDTVHALEQRIFDTPATTMAGLKAKAEILAFKGDQMSMPVDSPHGWSLVQDIMALGSAA